MKLLLALMIWSHGVCFASAAASPSAAADEKGAAADIKSASDIKTARSAVRASRPDDTDLKRSAAISGATSMIPEYPEIPKKLLTDLAILTISGGDAVSKSVTEWIMADPNNINGVHTIGEAEYQQSLLMEVIKAYGLAWPKGKKVTRDLLRQILELKPNVRYRASGDPEEPTNALHAILFDVLSKRTNHMEFIQKIIDLLLEQGTTPQEISDELREMLAIAEEDEQNPDPGYIRIFGHRKYGYAQKMVNAALKYLHDLQAAPILEEELTKRLGVPDLGRIGREYIAPLKKKGGRKAPSAGKSGDGK